MRYLIIPLVCFSLISAIILGVNHSLSCMDDTIKGKEVFHTEQAYTDFKLAVGNSDIDIHEMVILSSNPPVVVEYSLYIPQDIDFGYGERNTSAVLPVWGLILMIAFFGTIFSTVILSVK